MNTSDILPHNWHNLLTVACIGLIALLPRVLNLGVFVAGDEADFWIPRSERFLEALQTGTYESMPVLQHPGVTTMWLGSAGIALRRVLFEHGILHHETYATILALHRLPTALVHVAGILAGYAMLRRLLPIGIATLAALFWATDPFIIAYNRVLHVDGLAGTFATLSILAACCYQQPNRYGFTNSKPLILALSGISAGLAILSKSPTLVLLPTLGILFTLHTWRSWRLSGSKPKLMNDILPLLLWGTICAVTIYLAWPAIWTSPLQTYQLLLGGVEDEASSPHMLGNFFLGHTTDTPGLLFYPVALVMRTTPWTLAGLLLLPFALVHTQESRTDAKTHHILSLPSLRFGTNQSLVMTLALFIILFIIGMSIFPKKFNRYLVPTFPALDILAAVGIAYALHRLLPKPHQATRIAMGIVILIATSINAAWVHPYSIVYFNQLFGGAQAGAETFVVGWGEGYEQVAAYLNEQTDITGVVTLSRWGSTLNPYLRTGAQANGPENGTLPDQTGYVVVYIRHVQGQQPSAPFNQFYNRATPLHTVTIHGVAYAWVYHAPKRLAHSHKATFGSTIHMNGYTIDTSALRQTGILTLTVQWQAHAPPPHSYAFFAHILNAQGEHISQVDTLPGGAQRPTNIWQPGRYVTQAYPIPVPTDIAPGTYWVTLGVYNPDDFSRLPGAIEPPSRQEYQDSDVGMDKSMRNPANRPDDGPNVLYLDPIVIE